MGDDVPAPRPIVAANRPNVGECSEILQRLNTAIDDFTEGQHLGAGHRIGRYEGTASEAALQVMQDRHGLGEPH